MISADKNVRYEAVLDVMDLLQHNQVKRVGLLVQAEMRLLEQPDGTRGGAFLGAAPSRCI